MRLRLSPVTTLSDLRQAIREKTHARRTHVKKKSTKVKAMFRSQFAGVVKVLGGFFSATHARALSLSEVCRQAPGLEMSGRA